MSKTQKPYFMREDEESEILIEESQSFVDIKLAPPRIKFGDKLFVSVNELLNDEMYFELETSNDPGNYVTYITISDGLKFLPEKIRQLVVKNGWRCILVRGIRDNPDCTYSEEDSLAIFYGQTGKYLMGDATIKPCGAHSEIFAIYDDKTYAATFNGHEIAISEEVLFDCAIMTSNDRLRAIDFADERGVNCLYQCLYYQKH